MKKLSLFLVLIIAFSSLTACSTADKLYSESDFSITMPGNFFKKDLASATYYYESMSVIMTALKEEFSTLSVVELDGDSSIDDYANAVLTNNKIPTSDLKSREGKNYKYFTYKNSANGKTFFYTAAVFKGSDAFWLINFACDEKKTTNYEVKFLEWLDTVEVK